ncbi:hypothetical protein ACO22_04175 [Paracoccidioides brasiliensis]|uniref:Uncharacterized protein n=1 Tax=Paracoccidioides brasiliensis TaxID=121759 RepID=A0A1D2JE58_PARBR|nr:hypothetical protein ACO22_04175 [Paracoccidioides brasiliensis]
MILFTSQTETLIPGCAFSGWKESNSNPIIGLMKGRGEKYLIRRRSGNWEIWYRQGNEPSGRKGEEWEIFSFVKTLHRSGFVYLPEQQPALVRLEGQPIFKAEQENELHLTSKGGSSSSSRSRSRSRSRSSSRSK